MYHVSHTLLLQTGFNLLIARLALGQVDCSQPAPDPVPPDPNAPYGYIHDIIGKDGAFLLTLMRNPGRYSYSAAKLREAGIIANQFPAADAMCESELDVERGCYLNGDEAKNDVIKDQCKARQGWGWGCDRMTTAACAESHHRALELAQKRQSNWTLIMEDDVVPLDAANWQAHFKEVWPKVPGYAKLVRLGWCTFHHHADHGMSEAGPIEQMLPVNPRNVPEMLDASGVFKIVRHIYTDWYPYYYDAGLCTTGYLVHRDAIPDMLGIFPCCCGMDCCYGQALFNNPKDAEGKPWGIGTDLPWGYLNMVSIDMTNSSESTLGWNKHKLMYQFGPLVQDNREIGTARLDQQSAEVKHDHNAKKAMMDLEDMTSELDALMYMLHSPGISV